MNKRIFHAICAATLTVFVVTMVLIVGVLYDYFTTVQQNLLRSEISLAAQGTEKLGESFFDGQDIERYRVTWIGTDGSVLFDSASDSNAMENHLQREEIREALESGYGESARYSSTLMKRYLYCARRLSDGTVLRLSVSQDTVLVLLIGMLQPIMIILLVALALSFVLANRLSKRIVEPLNSLDLDEPLNNEGYDELAPLLRRIHSQQQQLRVQKDTLTQKQNELNAIVGNLEEGMILLDRQGRILTANRAALNLLNAKDTPAVGKDLLLLNRDWKLQQAVQEAMAGGHATEKTQLQGRTVRIHAAAIQSGQEISGVAVVLFDITQQEQGEQLRREFTANVSHELKTPLQSISGYSELIQCGMAKPEDIQPFAERIYSESQRLISLVEDIINLSHLDEGGSYEWKELDLYAEAEQVRQSLAEIAGEKGIRLMLEGESVIIRGVPDLIHGIVYNLCDNAIKYNRPEGTVTISVSREGKTAVLAVKDTGIGIPAEEIHRIFERFYRVDKSRSKEVGGTGLGLSIVKHAAMLHDAAVEVESKVGEGTTVFVRFPGQ